MGKSEKIGSVINGFEVLNSYQKISDTGKTRKTYYKVKCVSCGEVIDRWSNAIIKGTAKCNCNSRKTQRIGSIINGFKVIDSFKNKTNITFYKVKCVICGETHEKNAAMVNAGGSHSRCICQYERNHHGQSNTRLYRIWKGILVLKDRIRRGWSIERAFNQPIRNSSESKVN